MDARRPHHLQVVRSVEDAHASLQPAAPEGRPADAGGSPFDWVSTAVRLLATAWAGAVVVALIDEFAALPHLPFLLAMGMTGLLVVGTYLLTRNGMPSWRGDIAEAQEAKEPENDLLTDLPTFAMLQQRLDDEFLRARKLGKQVSIVLVDINNLTAVNKEYGVNAGDEVLRHVARAVDGTRRYSDLVARLGDDEFGVLLMDCGEEGVRAFIDRLEDRLGRDSAAAEVNGRTISLWAGVCSGSASLVPGMSAADQLLQAAMANLNGAKQERERRRRMWLSA